MSGRRIAWWCVVAFLTAATIAAVALGGWQLVAKRASSTPADGPAERNAVLEVARDDLPTMFSYTPETIESTIPNAAALMTDRFKKDFLDKARTDVIPQAKQRQITSQVSVVGAGVETLDSDRASVLVFMNRTVTQAGQEPQHDGSRLRMQLQKVDATWLVDDIQPV